MHWSGVSVMLYNHDYLCTGRNMVRVQVIFADSYLVSVSEVFLPVCMTCRASSRRR